MGEPVDSGAQESFRVFEGEDVGDDALAAGVRLVDDRAVQLGGQLLVLSVPVVDPDLDDVDVARDLVATAWRASSSFVTQWGASERPGSGAVMPRPAER